MKRKKAILFDLDGTLLNTLDDLADSFNAVMLAHNLPTRTRDEVCSFVGNGVAKLMERGIPDGQSHPLYETCLMEFKAHYADHMEDKTAPYEGVLPLLEALQKEGYLLGIVSNKFDLAVKGLSKKYFGDLIAVAIGESATVRKKPASDTVLTALKELGCQPEEAIYVGDSDVDIQTAANAGLPCISVTWGFRDEIFLKQHGAVYFAHQANDVIKQIKQMEEIFE